MSDEDDKIDSKVVDLVQATMARASQRRAAQADSTLSLEERIEHARKAGLLADASDAALIQTLLADAHLHLYRLLGSVGEGMTEPTLELRLRAALLPRYLRDLAQGMEALISHVYTPLGGADALMRDRAEHAAEGRALLAQACTCVPCLHARAAGRESRAHQ